VAGGAGRGRPFRALAPAARPSGGQRAPVADLAAPGGGTCPGGGTGGGGGCGIAGPCTPLSAGCRAAAPVLGQSAAGARSRRGRPSALALRHCPRSRRGGTAGMSGLGRLVQLPRSWWRAALLALVTLFIGTAILLPRYNPVTRSSLQEIGRAHV